MLTFNERLDLAARESRRGRYKRNRGLAEAIEALFDDVEGSMSTRQTFYQLVSRGQIANTAKEYDRTQRLLVQMRRDGSIAYDRVVDRSRAKHHHEGWAGVGEMLDTMSLAYRKDFWAAQETIVQIACEKQALEGIFGEVVDEYGASLWTLKGYASDGFAYEWSEDIAAYVAEGKTVAIYYFGDWDPSGLDIERKIQDRLLSHGAQFEWERAGLLEEDFDRFSLVHVPIKQADTRARAFVARHGERCAELDALPPDELRARIHGCYVQHLDEDAWERMRRTQAVERESLNLIARNFAVKAPTT